MHRKNLQRMDSKPAEPRAPATSKAKARRIARKREKMEEAAAEMAVASDEDGEIFREEVDDEEKDKKEGEEQTQQECRNNTLDYVAPKKAAALKRKLEPTGTPRSRGCDKRCKGSKDKNKNETEKSTAVLGGKSRSCTSFPTYGAGIALESEIRIRIGALLANLAKAAREKQLPLASSLVRDRNVGKKTGKHSFLKNVGADIVKVCLAQPMWSLAHRRNAGRGIDTWFENSDKILKALDKGDVDAANEALKRVAEMHLGYAAAERSGFELLGTVCNDLFRTRVLPNKKFDKNFVTIETNNGDTTVRSLSIPKLFRALNQSVWYKLTDVMDHLLMGGSTNNDSITALENCAANVLDRARTRPVEGMIKKAIERAEQAHKLSTGLFIPAEVRKQQKQQQQGLLVPPSLPFASPWGMQPAAVITTTNTTTNPFQAPGPFFNNGYYNPYMYNIHELQRPGAQYFGPYDYSNYPYMATFLGTQAAAAPNPNPNPIIIPPSPAKTSSPTPPSETQRVGGQPQPPTSPFVASSSPHTVAGPPSHNYYRSALPLPATSNAQPAAIPMPDKRIGRIPIMTPGHGLNLEEQRLPQQPPVTPDRTPRPLSPDSRIDQIPIIMTPGHGLNLEERRQQQQPHQLSIYEELSNAEDVEGNEFWQSLSAREMLRPRPGLYNLTNIDPSLSDDDNTESVVEGENDDLVYDDDELFLVRHTPVRQH